MSFAIQIPAALVALRPAMATIGVAAVTGAVAGLFLAYVSGWLALRLVPEAFEETSDVTLSGASTAWLAAHEEPAMASSTQWPMALLLAGAGAVMAVACLARFGVSITGGIAFFFAAALLLAGAIDWRYRILPDLITLPLVWVGLIANIDHRFAALPDAVVGAVVGYGVLWLLFLPLRILRQTDGIGFGDFKLYAAVGAWLGWTAMPQIFVLSLVLGTVGMLIGRLLNRDGISHISAFGPYIVAAALFTAMAGTPFNAQIRIPSSWHPVHQPAAPQALPRS